MVDRVTVEALRAARDLISGRERWCQGADALNEAGEEVDPLDGEATRRCMGGAICVVVGDDAHTTREICDGVADELGVTYLHEFNDNATHAEVLAAFDKAIALAEAAK